MALIALLAFAAHVALVRPHTGDGTVGYAGPQVVPVVRSIDVPQTAPAVSPTYGSVGGPAAAVSEVTFEAVSSAMAERARQEGLEEARREAESVDAALLAEDRRRSEQDFLARSNALAQELRREEIAAPRAEQGSTPTPSQGGPSLPTGGTPITAPNVSFPSVPQG